MNRLSIGLIGDNIGQSRFGAAMQLLSQTQGLTCDFQSIDTAVQPDFDLKHRLELLQRDGRTGVSITHPYKSDAVALIGAGCTAEVRKIGASNLVLFADQPRAFNTDYLGFLAAWRAVFQGRKPGRVVIAGAGGVARALCAALIQLKAEAIHIWDQTPARAVALAKAFAPNVHALPAENRQTAIRSADGLINATPLGMSAYPGNAYEGQPIGPQDWVFDAVYTPIKTPFIQTAKAKGLSALTGFDLFRFMAIESFGLYAGLTRPPIQYLPHLDALKPDT